MPLNVSSKPKPPSPQQKLLSSPILADFPTTAAELRKSAATKGSAVCEDCRETKGHIVSDDKSRCEACPGGRYAASNASAPPLASPDAHPKR